MMPLLNSSNAALTALVIELMSFCEVSISVWFLVWANTSHPLHGNLGSLLCVLKIKYSVYCKKGYKIITSTAISLQAYSLILCLMHSWFEFLKIICNTIVKIALT